MFPTTYLCPICGQWTNSPQHMMQHMQWSNMTGPAQNMSFGTMNEMFTGFRHQIPVEQPTITFLPHDFMTRSSQMVSPFRTGVPTLPALTGPSQSEVLLQKSNTQESSNSSNPPPENNNNNPPIQLNQETMIKLVQEIVKAIRPEQISQVNEQTSTTTTTTSVVAPNSENVRKIPSSNLTTTPIYQTPQRRNQSENDERNRIDESRDWFEKRKHEDSRPNFRKFSSENKDNQINSRNDSSRIHQNRSYQNFGNKRRKSEYFNRNTDGWNQNKNNYNNSTSNNSNFNRFNNNTHENKNNNDKNENNEEFTMRLYRLPRRGPSPPLIHYSPPPSPQWGNVGELWVTPSTTKSEKSGETNTQPNREIESSSRLATLNIS